MLSLKNQWLKDAMAETIHAWNIAIQLLACLICVIWLKCANMQSEMSRAGALWSLISILNFELFDWLFAACKLCWLLIVAFTLEYRDTDLVLFFLWQRSVAWSFAAFVQSIFVVASFEPWEKTLKRAREPKSVCRQEGHHQSLWHERQQASSDFQCCQRSWAPSFGGSATGLFGFDRVLALWRECIADCSERCCGPIPGFVGS